MGYAVQNISYIANLVQSLPTTGRRLIDLGSQDVKIFDDADYQVLENAVRRFEGDVKRLRNLVVPPYPVVITARDLFELSGFDYVCCDVDQRPATVYVDFNTLAFDRTLYGKFDFVINAGTTEHLPNPLAAFFLMHQLCRVGGILFNEVPFSGWTNHGLNNLTAKFWHTLRWMNSYRVLCATVKYVQNAAANDGNFGGDHLAFIENIGRAVDVSSSIMIVFQKTSDRGFIPPYDAVIPTDDGGKAVAKLVIGSLRPFIACGSLTATQAEESVNQFLAYQNLSFRYAAAADGVLSSPRERGSGLGFYLPQGLRNSAAVASIRRAVRGRK